MTELGEGSLGVVAMGLPSRVFKVGCVLLATVGRMLLAEVIRKLLNISSQVLLAVVC